MQPLVRKMAFSALLVLLAGVTVVAQVQADRAKPQRKDELVYLPNEKLLTHFTAGMSSVIADLLWLRCVQYTGAEFKTEHNYAWLNQLLNTIVRMDPYFRDVYRYGAIFLAGVKADDSAGLDLLQRGMLERPDAWELPYEAGMIYLLNRRDQPESRRLCALYLGMSAATGNAPQYVAETASSLQGKYNLDEIEADMWSSLEKRGDKVVRELAVRKQKELEIRRNLRTLDDNIVKFKEGAKRSPKDLEELIALGFFGAGAQANPKLILDDTLGGHYFIAPNDTAQNTTLLDNEKAKSLDTYRDAIKRYKEAKGAFPPTLDALVTEYIPQVFAHPYPGKDWTYNPATGDIDG